MDVTGGTSEAHGWISVRRAPGRRDAWRTYGIEIDGKRAGDLGPGEDVVIAVTPGRHVVRGRIDWTGSTEVEVLVTAGQTRAMHVQAYGPVIKAFAQMRIVGRTRYLELKVI